VAGTFTSVAASTSHGSGKELIGVNKVYLTVVDHKELLNDCRDQISAIIENIDNLGDLELIQALALNLMLSDRKGADQDNS